MCWGQNGFLWPPDPCLALGASCISHIFDYLHMKAPTYASLVPGIILSILHVLTKTREGAGSMVPILQVRNTKAQRD